MLRLVLRLRVLLMPRATRSYGRPGTQAIPAAWAASHAPVAEQFMTTSRVSLRKPGGTKDFNPASGHTDKVPSAPFAVDVPANIVALTDTSGGRAGGATDVVDDQVRVLGYLVTIPVSIPAGQLDEGVLVDVTSCPDGLLEGATLTVSDIVRGARLFERALLCDLNS